MTRDVAFQMLARAERALYLHRWRRARRVEALKLELIHLETDIAAGRARDKLVQTVRALRKKLK